MLSVIGIGPGSQAMMTMEAIEALQAAENRRGLQNLYPSG